MIGNLRAAVEWKIGLTMKIDFMSSKDSGKSQPKDSQTNSIEILIGNDTNKIVMSLLVHLLLHFKIGLETSVKGSHFAFDSVDGM